MKKLANLFTIIIVALSFTSCVQSLLGGENGNVSFNVRAIDSAYDGATIKVSVINDDVVFSSQYQDIKISEEKEYRFLFDDLIPGNDIQIVAEITKVINGQKEILYEGHTEKITVKSGKNEVKALTLDQVCPRLTVSVSKNADVNNSFVLNGIFEVYVNDDVQKLKINDENQELALDFFVPKNTSVDVSAVITDSKGNIVYDFIPEVVDMESSKKVELNTIPTRYMFWNNTNPVDKTVYGSPIYDIYQSNELNPNYSIQKVESPDKLMIDFCITNYQDVYTLEGYGVSQDMKVKVMDNDNINYPKEIPTNLVFDNLEGTSQSNFKMAYYEGKNEQRYLFFINIETVLSTGQSSYVILYTNIDKPSDNGTMKIQLPRNDVDKLTAVAIGNEHLYLSERYIDTDYVYFRILDFGTVDNLMEKNTAVPTVLFDSHEKTLQINDKQIKLDMSEVSDLTVIDDKLYGLVIFMLSSNSKGGLITIDLTSKNITASNFYISESVSDEYFSHDRKWMLESNIPYYFVGPRRFVATKPKKLIIVDDGVYAKTSDPNPELVECNRVITIDLMNKMEKSIVDMHSLSFTGYATSGDCGYIYNPGIEE